MTLAQALTVAGGTCLLLGLVTALYASRYVTRSDTWLHVGIFLSAAGVVLQTAGALLAVR